MEGLGAEEGYLSVRSPRHKATSGVRSQDSVSMEYQGRADKKEDGIFL